MANLEELERAIANLREEDYRQFRRWVPGKRLGKVE